MVKRSLYITFSLLILYGLFIKFFNVAPVDQQQFQGNLIRAQNYMYNDSIKKLDLIIGTSISAGIQTGRMQKGIYLVTLPGQSIYDGLALIENSKSHPKYIFVEGNSILATARPEFIKYLFSPPNYYKKKYFPFLRDCYQPAGQTYNMIANHAMGSIRRFSKYAFNPLVSVFGKGKIEKINEDNFYAEAKGKSQIVDTPQLKEAFLKLRAQISLIEKGGTKVCFYVVPNAPAIYNNNLSKTIRDFFPKYFPQPAYKYIWAPDINQYHTVDQIHLDSVSCIRFTDYLSAKMSAIRQQTN